MLDKQSYTLLLAQNNETAAKVAHEVALEQFKKNPEIQLLFAPLLDDVKGMGSMVASELAWKLFLLLKTTDRNGND